MTVIAVIPARGGSKGVPRKNLQPVGGLSLVARSIITARNCAAIDRVAVSTDDPEIAAEAALHGAEVVKRPAALGTDSATSESALLHAIEQTLGEPDDDDHIVLMQCTSPFVDPAALSSALKQTTTGGHDVVFSAVPSHSFIWSRDDQSMTGINHRASVRLRRQDRKQEFLETGAFYVMRAKGFCDAKHRFFGHIGIVEVPQEHSIEIDTPADLACAQDVAYRIDPLGLAALRSSSVHALVLDFDGVLTDNTAILTEEGIEAAKVNRSDGLGIACAKVAGLRILILSTERNPIVERRAEKLGVDCISDCSDKLPALKEWASSNSLDRERIAYVGNDINDRECLQWVGAPIIVSDAHRSVRNLGALSTSQKGGNGAVREVIDALLGE